MPKRGTKRRAARSAQSSTKSTASSRTGSRSKPESSDQLSPADTQDLSQLQRYSMAEAEQLLLAPSRLNRAESTDLAEFLGKEQFEELRAIAEDILLREQRTRAGARFWGTGQRVLVIPGLMGSTLGTPSNTIWFDPIDIARGNITKLKLPDRSNRAKDIIPFAYLKLKLLLRWEGFKVEHWFYDWRQSLDKLGNSLNRRLAAEPGPISLVAHSMGGMVARAALAKAGSSADQKVDKLVMLGTPNFGSYEPILAIRENNETVENLAWIDLQNETPELSSVFKTFPGLVQLMPTKEKLNDQVDLYNADNWPASRQRPTQKLLDDAQKIQNQSLLAPDDPRCTVIAGIENETVVGVRATTSGNQLIYQRSLDGDGTVPRKLAVLDKARSYYVKESHSGLPNNRKVAKAAAQIIRGEKVTAVSATEPRERREIPSEIAEDQIFHLRSKLRKTEEDRWQPDAVRELASKFISARSSEVSSFQPTPAEEDHTAAESDSETASGGDLTDTSKAASEVSLNDLVVSRQRQWRFEVNLAHGDVAQLRTRAVVVGMFQAVRPSGPAAALDRRLQGTISEFIDRRMFAANVGEIQILPTNRHDVRCELVVLAGLGAFDTFSKSVLRRVSENVGRCLLRSHVDEIGTVLIGSASKLSISDSLDALLGGFFTSIREARKELQKTFRGVTVCEFDKQRYEHMKDAVYHLARTKLFEDHQVTLDEVKLDKAPPQVRTLADTPDPVYLIARSEGKSEGGAAQEYALNLSVLTANGAKASTVSGTMRIPTDTMHQLVRQVDYGAPADLKQYGMQWEQAVLTEDIRQVLLTQADHHLVVVHDRLASRIPWETFHLKLDNQGFWSPAARRGISRRYLAQDMAAAAWMSTRKQETTLNVLLVVDPTGDLKGAEREGKALLDMFGKDSSIKITPLRKEQATRDKLRQLLGSGKFDVVHYAGHAYFDSLNPGQSGVLCAGKEVLSGEDLLGITNLPSLMFFNACQAARVRRMSRPESEVSRRSPGLAEYEVAEFTKKTGNQKTTATAADDDAAPEVSQVSEANSGLAEAFLRGGVANYVGTYWPVDDRSALLFAKEFYTKLLNKSSIGDAVHAGREQLRDDEREDWANYVLFGDHNFQLRGDEDG